MARIQVVPREQAGPAPLRGDLERFWGRALVLGDGIAGDDGWPLYLQRFAGLFSREG